MRYGIISDIHANLEALTAVIDALQSQRINGYLCCGDIVGYGANPHECIELVKSLNAFCVAGNHDWAAIDRMDMSWFSFSAQKSLEWTKQQLTKDDGDFLRSLELIVKTEDFILVHSGLREAGRFHYVYSINQALDMFSLIDRKICLVGHTHAPTIFKKAASYIDMVGSFEFALEKDCQYIVNVGSVGQPRDYDPRAAFGIFDSVAKTISIKRVPYDIQKTQEKMTAAGLPQSLVERLAIGR